MLSNGTMICSDGDSAPAGGRRLRLAANATVFFSSACIMVVELVAGRLISRHLGQSLYTWTAVIGVILAGISIGNLVGGRLADCFPPRRALAALFFLAALGCLAAPALNRLAGEGPWLWTLPWPARIVAHVGLVFLVPAILLGTISPVAARMALDPRRRAGRTLGDVYAWGAAGALAGAFLAGFVLVAHAGVTAIVQASGGGLALLGLIYAASSSRL